MPPSSRVFYNLIYAVLVLALALIVFILFLRTSQIGVNGKATFEKVLTGTAYRPYIYRQLLPIAASALSPYVDGMWALRLGRQSERVLGDRFFRGQLNGRLYPRQVVLILAMMYLSLAAFPATMWFLARELGYGWKARYLMPVAALLTTTVFFGYGYMYDFTVLFLFTLGLWLMYRRAWIAYLLVFALGTLNKETTLFLVLIFALYYWHRLPRRRLWSLTAAQLGIFALIQGALRYRFRNNPGATVEWHLPDQIATYQGIFMHAPWWMAASLVGLALIALAVIRSWKQKPEFLRVALTPLPFFVVLMLLWGYPLEGRAAMEMLPVLALLMLPPPSGVVSRGIAAREMMTD